MEHFDIKKYLIEQKATSVSKTLDEIGFKIEEPEYEYEGRMKSPEDVLSDVSIFLSTQDAEDLVQAPETVLETIISIIEDYGFYIEKGKFTDDLINSFIELAQSGLIEQNPKAGARKALELLMDPFSFKPHSQKPHYNESKNTMSFDLKNFLKENKLTTNSILLEEAEPDNTQYFKYKTPEEIIREVDKQIAKESIEKKIDRLGEIASALDSKISSIEEDAELDGIVNNSRLREMRKCEKGVRKVQERLVREYEKRYKNTK